MRFLLFSLLLWPLGLVNGQKYDFSHVPGTVIAHRPVVEQTYLGTPSICVLPDGKYVASHGIFGKKQNEVSIYWSVDKGKSWEKVSQVKGFWSGLFWHQDALYLMGVDGKYGDIIIRRSDDEGTTWTKPEDRNSGVIRQHTVEKGYHTSAVSLVVANGRIYRPFEVARRSWEWGNFEALVLSAPVDADLLKAESWITTTRMAVDTSWGKNHDTWLEGGAVLSPEGHVLNILRVNNREEETAAIMHVSDDGKKLSFSSETGFISFPGGCKRFVIRYDKESERYWTLTNWIPEEFEGHNIERTRNTLALASSENLHDWVINEIVLQDDNVEKSGFQYVDWQTEGEDIVFVSRTAFFDGVDYADNQHNSNFITFHRLRNFRDKTKDILTTINN